MTQSEIHINFWQGLDIWMFIVITALCIGVSKLEREVTKLRERIQQIQRFRQRVRKTDTPPRW